MDQASSPLIAKLPITPRDGTPDAVAQQDFVALMASLGYHSVFDIIRDSRATFVTRTRSRWTGDSGTAYDNAVCYATQLVLLYREQETSSGRMQASTRRSGVRALVDIGPSYPNLFKENWDRFCKSGALEAKDSPAAYLTELYRWARAREAEGGLSKIPLDTRRPDLAGLRIDHASTFEPVPVLSIVNDVLMASIDRYHAQTGNEQPIYASLAQRRHPFLFPYDHQHRQITLWLGEMKASLGELILRLRPELPPTDEPIDVSGPLGYALAALTELAPAQQRCVTEAPIFSTFYLTAADLLATDRWRGPALATCLPWSDIRRHAYVVAPEQPEVQGPAEVDRDLAVTLTVALHPASGAGLPRTLNTILVETGKQNNEGYKRLNESAQLDTQNRSKYLVISYRPENNDGNPLPADGLYTSRFALRAQTPAGVLSPQARSFLELSFTLVVDTDQPAGFTLTPEQHAFFKTHYGIEVFDGEAAMLANVPTFLDRTGLSSELLDALIARGAYAPNVSANCLPANPLMIDPVVDINHRDVRFPYPRHYGAGFVNGVGAAVTDDRLDGSLNLQSEKTDGQTRWRLINTSLDRYDRLQRMIRLQRWLGLGFAELDALIMASIRAEGETNLGMKLNANSLRTLGAFRYFSRKFRIRAEEFAALLDEISPFACGQATPLFDTVFNRPSLFETPFVLDHGQFSEQAEDEASQRTIAQLCVSLGLKPTPGSYGRIAGQTKTALGLAALTRSLPTVSSLYRQARIARMFGLSPEDAQDVLQWLGGDAYVRIVARGQLEPVPEPESKSKTKTEPPAEREHASVTRSVDILDVLMQLDWAVGWLKDSGQTVESVQRALGRLPSTESANAAFMEGLKRLAQAIEAVRVTEASLAPLQLPAQDDDGDDIDWLDVLHDALNEDGFVLQYMPSWTQQASELLRETIRFRMTYVKLHAAVKEAVLSRLVDVIESARLAQIELIGAELYQATGLPPTSAALVVAWAGMRETMAGWLDATLLHDVLSLALAAAKTPTDTDALNAYVERSGTIHRYAKVALQWELSPLALHALLSNPVWFTESSQYSSLTLTLRTLYLLQRYQAWLKQAGAHEDDVLHYFKIATASASTAQQCASALAPLVGLSADDVRAATASMYRQIARTFPQVEWLLRVSELSRDTGLTVRGLLEAGSLNIDSDQAAWARASEAIGAVRPASAKQ